MTGAELLRTWEADPFALAFAAMGTGAYLRFAKHGRRWLFGVAVGLFLVALLSPIAVLSRGLVFGAHMLQHLILVLFVPPLVLLSLPPREGGLRWSPTPLVAWGMGVGAMWLWHAPVMCNAAATSVPVQHLQTLSLLAMGGAYWWPVIGPLRGQRLEPLRAAAYLFSACVACTILGIIVTFSPVSPCNAFAHPVDPAGALALVRDQWGLTAKMDQEIGGLLMWVPTCFVYTAAILAMLGRYWGAERRPAVKGGAA